MEKKIHLKGLNGLRAIAAMGVVIAHATSMLSDPGLSSVLPLGLATYSVTIFFTLSGFLITYLLFIEKERTGISIKNFYIRRILRIWPLYFSYLLITFVIIWFLFAGKLPGTLPYYLFFAANVPTLLHSQLPYLGHYWSLAGEEQFYMFWPWLIKRPANVLKAIIIFTSVFFVLRVIARVFYFEEGKVGLLSVLNLTGFESMSIGGIAALLCIKKNAVFFKIMANKFTEIACWLCIGIIAFNKFSVSPFVNQDIGALITVGLIVNLSFNTNAIISLENRCFDLLGRISYGIYVIHPLIILVFYQLLKYLNWSRLWKYLFFYSGVYLFTIIVAWLSYEFFEKRFLQLKSRFTVVKNSG